MAIRYFRNKGGRGEGVNELLRIVIFIPTPPFRMGEICLYEKSSLLVNQWRRRIFSNLFLNIIIIELKGALFIPRGGGGPSCPPIQPPLSLNNLVLHFQETVPLINMCIGWCCPGWWTCWRKEWSVRWRWCTTKEKMFVKMLSVS